MTKREGLSKKEKPKNYIFEILNDIKVHKKGNLLERSEYEKSFDKFVILRFLSMNDDNCEIVNYINEFYDVLSKKQLYALLIELIPITKTYDAYIKHEKEIELEDPRLVSELYECSMKDAGEYIKIMGNDWFNDVKVKFGRTL
jgi:hypothetical protein